LIKAIVLKQCPYLKQEAGKKPLFLSCFFIESVLKVWRCFDILGRYPIQEFHGHGVPWSSCWIIASIRNETPASTAL